jgi:ABC-type nitrate/sulfonate/bicarbonate transport system permease component
MTDFFEDPPSPAAPRRRASRLLSLALRRPHLTLSPVILVLLIASWWLATHALGVPPYVLPAPGMCCRR